MSDLQSYIHILHIVHTIIILLPWVVIFLILRNIKMINDVNRKQNECIEMQFDVSRKQVILNDAQSKINDEIKNRLLALESEMKGS